MASPFAGIAENCTLQFQVPTGEVTTDDLGNVVEEFKSVTVRAFMKKLLDAQARQTNRSPGVADLAWMLDGYCTDPMILPASVKEECWAEATWSGMKGKFFLIAPINPPHGRQGIGAILEQSAGTKIQGFFQKA